VNHSAFGLKVQSTISIAQSKLYLLITLIRYQPGPIVLINNYSGVLQYLGVIYMNMEQ